MSSAVPAIFDCKFQMQAHPFAPSLLVTCPDNPIVFYRQPSAPIAEESDMDELTLWQEDHPAKTSQWLDAVQDWTAQGADCSGTNAVSLLRAVPLGFSGKTARTSPPCCGDSPDADQPCPRTGGARSACASAPNEPQSGGCLTLDGSEWPSDAAVCSLSQVLETSVDPKYSLSPRAAAGILERARRRGKTLPPTLAEALRLAC
jgi:hypothetical protein